MLYRYTGPDPRHYPYARVEGAHLCVSVEPGDVVDLDEAPDVHFTPHLDYAAGGSILPARESDEDEVLYVTPAAPLTPSAAEPEAEEE